MAKTEAKRLASLTEAKDGPFSKDCFYLQMFYYSIKFENKNEPKDSVSRLDRVNSIRAVVKK